MVFLEKVIQEAITYASHSKYKRTYTTCSYLQYNIVLLLFHFFISWLIILIFVCQSNWNFFLRQ